MALRFLSPSENLITSAALQLVQNPLVAKLLLRAGGMQLTLADPSTSFQLPFNIIYNII